MYLHGTSEPWLFNSSVRANSSGCVRVENPLEVAHYVLRDNKDYENLNIDEIYKTFDNNYDIPYYDKPKHHKIKLDKNLPFYSSYFTVKANKYGELEFFEDIYNWDNLGI